MWWWPDRLGQYFWPANVPRRRTLSAFVQAYGQRGYEQCGSDAFEPEFEKIALFADSDGLPTHAARQLPTGRWTSKLGRLEDIEHDLTGLEGEQYGSIAVIMMRPRKWPESAPTST